MTKSEMGKKNEESKEMDMSINPLQENIKKVTNCIIIIVIIIKWIECLHFYNDVCFGYIHLFASYTFLGIIFLYDFWYHCFLHSLAILNVFLYRVRPFRVHFLRHVHFYPYIFLLRFVFFLSFSVFVLWI